MDESRCAVCGRILRRRKWSYELGRPGSAPYYHYGAWFHVDDLSPACKEEDDGTG